MLLRPLRTFTVLQGTVLFYIGLLSNRGSDGAEDEIFQDKAGQGGTDENCDIKGGLNRFSPLDDPAEQKPDCHGS
jgi:hypothetical protein